MSRSAVRCAVRRKIRLVISFRGDDTGREPRLSFCFKPVPLINEVSKSSGVTSGRAASRDKCACAVNASATSGFMNDKDVAAGCGRGILTLYILYLGWVRTIYIVGMGRIMGGTLYAVRHVSLQTNF